MPKFIVYVETPYGTDVVVREYESKQAAEDDAYLCWLEQVEANCGYSDAYEYSEEKLKELED